MRFPTIVLALALCAGAMAEDAKSEDKSAESLRLVSEGTGHFATNLFKEIAKDKKGENLISSPLSADVVLSMAAYGAGGNTAVQMRQALHLPSDDSVAKEGFSSLIDKLNKVENVTLEIANKIFLANGLKLKSQFKELTSGSFRSETSELDTSKPAESTKIVNAWVEEKTHNKIKDIVKEDDINADTRMLLLNAVYFKGKWKKEFKKEGTADKPFHLDEKTEKKVPTMFVSGSFVYGELNDIDAKFVELPYTNKDLKMVIVVPNKINGLNKIIDNLELINATRLSNDGTERDVQLWLPKFKIESEIQMEEPLKRLGMTDMFDNGANFTNIADEPLKIAKVIQKAFIEVNEEGSEAAAATAGSIVLLSFVEPKLVTIDRPFLFKIIDNVSKVTLFVGSVINPENN